MRHDFLLLVDVFRRRLGLLREKNFLFDRKGIEIIRIIINVIKTVCY